MIKFELVDHSAHSNGFSNGKFGHWWGMFSEQAKRDVQVAIILALEADPDGTMELIRKGQNGRGKFNVCVRPQPVSGGNPDGSTYHAMQLKAHFYQGNCTVMGGANDLWATLEFEVKPVTVPDGAYTCRQGPFGLYSQSRNLLETLGNEPFVRFDTSNSKPFINYDTLADMVFNDKGEVPWAEDVYLFFDADYDSRL